MVESSRLDRVRTWSKYTRPLGVRLVAMKESMNALKPSLYILLPVSLKSRSCTAEAVGGEVGGGVTRLGPSLRQ